MGDPAYSNLPQTTATRYAAHYTYWQTILTNLQAQLTARSLDQPIDSYSFDSGEGRQSTTRMSIDQLMAAVERAERMVRYYEMKLYGRGLMSLVLRRK